MEMGCSGINHTSLLTYIEMGQGPHQYTLQDFDVLLFRYICFAVFSKHVGTGGRSSASSTFD